MLFTPQVTLLYSRGCSYDFCSARPGSKRGVNRVTALMRHNAEF